MPASRLALATFLLVLVVGLEPAHAGGSALVASPAPTTSASGPSAGSPTAAGVRPSSVTTPDPGTPGSSGQPLARAPRVELDESLVGEPSAEPAEEVAPEPSASAVPTAEPTRPPSCTPPPEGLAPAPVVRNGSRTRKVVALTFDDGWDDDNTLRILRTLRGSRVNATFFPLGKAILGSPSVWRAVAAAGYPIADHTYDHARLAGRCYRTQLSELTRWQSTVRRVLGIEPLRVMRPPGGAFDRTTRLAAAGADERAVVIWDIDTRDWSGLRASAIASRALAGQSGSIVLMHTNPANTAAALPSIISGYRARGFTFVTIGQMLGLGGPVPW